jgi:hypothetical protein
MDKISAARIHIADSHLTSSQVKSVCAVAIQVLACKITWSFGFVSAYAMASNAADPLENVLQ